MRRIGVVTGGRADYGIYRPVLRKIAAESGLELKLYATGMHFSARFGDTLREIENDGFEISARLPLPLEDDSPLGTSQSMAAAVAEFGKLYAQAAPDLLLVLGDRFEMFSAVAAAVPFALPVAHIHGGELTGGAIDEFFRHAITKMSHLHFVTTPEYRSRVIQMGEDPRRVFLSGAPGLDNLKTFQPLSAGAVEQLLGRKLPADALLVTYHPETLNLEKNAESIDALLEVLSNSGRFVVFTAPNADAGGRLVLEKIEAFLRNNDNAVLVKNLGTCGYFTLMSQAAAMVGNSSSGIIEAASFKLPVLNIGGRQAGRVRGSNVLDVAPEKAEMTRGLKKVTAPEFKAGLKDLVNPYGSGDAAGKIVTELIRVNLKDLRTKAFYT